MLPERRYVGGGEKSALFGKRMQNAGLEGTNSSTEKKGNGVTKAATERRKKNFKAFTVLKRQRGGDSNRGFEEMLGASKKRMPKEGKETHSLKKKVSISEKLPYTLTGMANR